MVSILHSGVQSVSSAANRPVHATNRITLDYDERYAQLDLEVFWSTQAQTLEVLWSTHAQTVAKSRARLRNLNISFILWRANWAVPNAINISCDGYLHCTVATWRRRRLLNFPTGDKILCL